MKYNYWIQTIILYQNFKKKPLARNLFYQYPQKRNSKKLFFFTPTIFNNHVQTFLKSSGNNERQCALPGK